MRPLLPLLALLTLPCAFALAAPTAKLEQDRDRESAAIVMPGQWFDLLLEVDPGGEAIAEEGLEAKGEGKGAEFDAAIFPAPDQPGAFAKPFTVRVPAKLAAKGEVAVTLTGKTSAGKPLTVRASRKQDLLGRMLQVSATAALKEPVVAGRDNAVVVKATVLSGYHVYGTDEDVGVPLKGMLLPAPGARGATPWTGVAEVIPKGKELKGSFSFEIPFTPERAGKLPMRVLLDWQACTEMQCDPNAIAYIEVAEAGAASAPAGKGGLWALIGAAVAAGIVALLMPCTYPLIPITISFFTKQADARRQSVVPLAVAYGLGITAIFTLIGVAVSTAFVAGETILDVASGWPLNLVFALLFLAFGLSLLGLFDIRLPSFFDDLAAKASGSGGYMSVFVMGLTLVITSFTCTVPFVGGLLVLAAKDGEAGRAILAMAVFGLTMAIPFVILSLSPHAFQALPKSGEWMKRLKVTLGIIELGLVLKFVSNVDIATGKFIIGRTPFLVLWGVSFLAAGLYLLGFFDLVGRAARWTPGFGRAVVGLLMLGITGVLAYGATGEGLDTLLGPEAGARVESFLPQFQTKAGDKEEVPDYGKAFLAVTHSYEEGVRLAQAKGANIFLHFTAYT